MIVQSFHLMEELCGMLGVEMLVLSGLEPLSSVKESFGLGVHLVLKRGNYDICHNHRLDIYLILVYN